MNRLAIDIGTKYTGICLCLMDIPIPYKRVKNKSLDDELRALIEEHSIEEVIIGEPLSGRREETDMSRWIKKYVSTVDSIKDLRKIYINERLTSKKAERLIKDNMGKKDYKMKIDPVSACLIMEYYLDEIKE
ncbi:MAG: Holliday junction resolvase RuvX [bacterium]